MDVKGYLEKYHNNRFFKEDISSFSDYYKKYPRVEVKSKKEVASKYINKNGDYVKVDSPSDGKALVLCCGDILCEDLIYKASKTDDGFNFKPAFRYVKGILKEADLAIANLETLFVDEFPYTGELVRLKDVDRYKYNNNAPIEFLEAIVDSGFDMLTLSNNHNLDWGMLGIEKTIEKLDERNIIHTGLFTDINDNRVKIVDVNGIRIAVLAYSSWFNSNEHRITKHGETVVINRYSINRLRDDIKEAKAKGAEYIMVSIHWGVDSEYRHKASKSQRKVAQEIAKTGVDIIIGSHPHSPQEIEYVRGSDRDIPVVYSLGNFITSDRTKISRDNYIVALNLTKKEGAVNTELRYLPCHVFEKFDGSSYPTVPVSYDLDSLDMNKEEYAKVKRELADVEDKITSVSNKYFKPYGFGEHYTLTLSKISEILGFDKPLFDAVYSSVKYADEAIVNSVAIASPFSSDVNYIPSKETVLKKARIAVDKGASLIISSVELGSDINHIVYPRPIEAILKIASHYRDLNSQVKTTAITGSMGKTVLNDMLSSVLCAQINVKHTTGSASSFRYVLRNILGLNKAYDGYVQEVKEGPPVGCANSISQMLKPDIAIITSIDKAHIKEFKTIDRIRECIFGIESGICEGGYIITNADDNEQEKFNSNVNRIRYGIHSDKCDYCASNIVSISDGTKFTLRYDGKEIEVKINLFGEYNVYNALATFAASKLYGLNDEQIVKGLKSYKPSGIRQNLVKIDGKQFYLDCYNATLDSVSRAINVIEEIESLRKVAILGDILDLGDLEVSEHEKLGRVISSSNIDVAIFYGRAMKSAYDKANQNKSDSIQLFYTNDESELLDFVSQNLRDGDCVLLKGSRDLSMELVVDKIYGTYYNEHFKRYNSKISRHTFEGANYIDFGDHVNLTKGVVSGEKPVLPKMIIEKKVTVIDRAAFTRNNVIKEVVIPEGYKCIRYCAFYKNENLKEVVISNSVRRIEVSAFSTCKNLEKLTINEGCYFIGYRAFGSCNKLRKVTLPRTIKELDGNVFDGIDQIEVSVYKDSQAYEILSKAKYGNIILKLI